MMPIQVYTSMSDNQGYTSEDIDDIMWGSISEVAHEIREGIDKAATTRTAEDITLLTARARQAKLDAKKAKVKAAKKAKRKAAKKAAKAAKKAAKAKAKANAKKAAKNAANKAKRKAAKHLLEFAHIMVPRKRPRK